MAAGQTAQMGAEGQKPVSWFWRQLFSIVVLVWQRAEALPSAYKTTGWGHVTFSLNLPERPHLQTQGFNMG